MSQTSIGSVEGCLLPLPPSRYARSCRPGVLRLSDNNDPARLYPIPNTQGKLQARVCPATGSCTALYVVPHVPLATDPSCPGGCLVWQSLVSEDCRQTALAPPNATVDCMQWTPDGLFLLTVSTLFLELWDVHYSSSAPFVWSS